MHKQQFDERVAAAGRKLPLEKSKVVLTNFGTSPELSNSQVEALLKKLGMPTVKFHRIGRGLWSAVVDVTSEMALLWLTEFNSQNRDPTKAQYEAISGDILSSQWALTHQGLAFTGEGRLLDGQHRLFAILDTGVTVPTVITLNVSKESALVIDRHRSRRARDLLNFSEHRMTLFDEAVIRRAISGMQNNSAAPTVPTIVSFLQTHRERLEWSTGLFKSRSRGIVVAPLVAAVFRASFHVKDGELKALEHFTAVVQEGVVEGPEEQAAVILRDWLLARGRATRKRATGQETYARVVRAIAAFLAKERLSKLYAASADLYPMPASPQEEGS